MTGESEVQDKSRNSVFKITNKDRTKSLEKHELFIGKPSWYDKNGRILLQSIYLYSAPPNYTKIMSESRKNH